MHTFMRKFGVLAAALSAVLSASAQRFEVDGITYSVTDPTAKEVQVVNNGVVGKKGDVVLPASVAYNGEQYTVTAIAWNAFHYNNDGMTSITIPNTVVIIGETAFKDCSSLTSVILSNSLTTIENGAFSGCSSLTSITIPNSVKSVGSNAFYGCRSLASLTISNSITTIGKSAFSHCGSLTSIKLPDSATAIGDFAFSSCDNLTSIDVDADNPTYSSIDGVLYNKAQTNLICWPAGKVGDVIIPNSVTAIGNSAFCGCINLTSIDIPSSVKTIEEDAFYSCSNLSSIAIPNSVTAIGSHAFDSCSSLTSIDIPNSVTAIGRYAFSYCSSLTSIVIPNSVTAIEEGTFQSCSNLTSITIPNSVTTIGDCAFMQCHGMTAIDIPDSVTAIGDHAFETCIGLTSINIPGSVTIIEEYAFRACRGLTSITIPNSVTAIRDRAFEGCEGLTSITLSNSISTIGKSVFYGCSKLTSITIPSSVTTIDDFAFGYCNLNSLTSYAAIPPQCTSKTFYEIDMQQCKLYVPAGSKEAYQQAPEWQNFELVEELAPVLVAEIQLNETEVNMEEKKTFQLTAEVLPADATIKDLLWESSDESCVTVDETGLLTAKKQGVATITVRSADGNAEATCAVKVVPTTGITAVEAGADSSVEVFNLTGAKVADSLDNLPAGIYIVNRRKVIVR